MTALALLLAEAGVASGVLDAAFVDEGRRAALPGGREPPHMILAAHTVPEQQIEASDWVHRLVDMASAYADPRHEHQPQVVACCVCPNRFCVRIGTSVPRALPGLLEDLVRMARLAGAVDYTALCPKTRKPLEPA